MENTYIAHTLSSYKDGVTTFRRLAPDTLPDPVEGMAALPVNVVNDVLYLIRLDADGRMNPGKRASINKCVDLLVHHLRAVNAALHAALKAAGESGLTYQEVNRGLENLGFDPGCPVHSSIFFTGGTEAKDCSCSKRMAPEEKA